MKALILLFVSAIAFAQDAQIPQQDTPTDMPPVHVGRRGSKRKTLKRLEKSVPKKAPDHIVGQCVVIPGGGNLMPAPCAEVILTLQGKGDPIHTRTDRLGQFEFITEQGEDYKVISGSKFYEVVQPDKSVHSGDSIEIDLKQK